MAVVVPATVLSLCSLLCLLIYRGRGIDGGAIAAFLLMPVFFVGGLLVFSAATFCFRKHIRRSFWANLSISLVLGALVVCNALKSDGTVHRASFKLPGHLRVVVSQDSWADPLASVYCAVEGREGKKVMGKTRIAAGALGKPFRFTLLKSSDGRVVALTESSRPNTVLMLLDCETVAFWPGDSRDAEKLGRDLLKRFQESDHENSYHLAYGSVILGGK